MFENLDMTEAENHRLSYWKRASRIKDLYIGGGYLRDTLLGRPIKDIDVYLYHKVPWEELQPFIGNLVEQGKITKSGEDYDTSLYHFIGESVGTRINMLFPKHSMRQIVSGWDINLCKVYYNVKQDMLHQRVGFKHDVNNKTITINPNYYSREHTIRIMKKYPEYTVEGCPTITGLPY